MQEAVQKQGLSTETGLVKIHKWLVELLPTVKRGTSRVFRPTSETLIAGRLRRNNVVKQHYKDLSSEPFSLSPFASLRRVLSASRNYSASLQIKKLFCLLSIFIMMSWRQSVSPSSSQENLSPVSTPATSPPKSRATTPQAAERPLPGQFMFMPPGTEIVWSSQANPGSPGQHPVLVLSDEDPDSDLVRVAFATTKDVVSCCTARSWGCNYVPLEGQVHPWREAIPLAQGAFRRATSINVTTVLKVRWSDLDTLDARTVDGLPRLSAEALGTVMSYVNAPKADISTAWSTTAPADNSAAHSSDLVAPASVLPTFAALSIRDPVPVPVLAAILAPVPAQGTAQKYVPPHLRQAKSMDSNLRPTAPEFQPRPTLRSGSWRRSY
jgi:hypothetical protein